MELGIHLNAAKKRITFNPEEVLLLKKKRVIERNALRGGNPHFKALTARKSS